MRTLARSLLLVTLFATVFASAAPHEIRTIVRIPVAGSSEKIDVEATPKFVPSSAKTTLQVACGALVGAAGGYAYSHGNLMSTGMMALLGAAGAYFNRGISELVVGLPFTYTADGYVPSAYQSYYLGAEESVRGSLKKFLRSELRFSGGFRTLEDPFLVIEGYFDRHQVPFRGKLVTIDIFRISEVRVFDAAERGYDKTLDIKKGYLTSDFD